MADVESLNPGDETKRSFEEVDAEEAEDPTCKRAKGTGVFAYLDDRDDDDFGSIIEDNLARLNGTAPAASHSQSFSFGGAAASMTTPRLPGTYMGPGIKQGFLPPPGSHQADKEEAEVEGPAVMCQCGLACNKLEAKTEKNAGRMFFRCPKQRDEGQCQFFQWEDEPPRSPTGGTPAPPPSPGGRPAMGACFKCGQSGTAAYGGVGGSYGAGGGYGTGAAGYGSGGGSYGAGNDAHGGATAAGGGGASGACFKCGQSGHWAANCPSGLRSFPKFDPNDRGDGGAPYGTGRPSGGGAERDRSNDTCYKCGQTGHWSSACTVSKSGDGYGGGGGYGGSGGFGKKGGSGYGTYGGGGCGGGGGGACYKCGETGHFSRDCTKGGRGSYGAY